LASGGCLVCDTIPNATMLNQSLRMLREQGTLVRLGLPGKVDWTLTLLKEIKIVGSATYGSEVLKGKRVDHLCLCIWFPRTWLC
jgi:D-arabinose 1-dehydrogenase-like Zn-dependent alcohol dehydrogenase